jgi:uncharacterized cofD-like protein
MLRALDVARSMGAPPPPPERDGPSVVALGGGHGLSATLRAARRYAGPITAVVSVADDGGSSGRIRHLLPDMPAPGDLRKCLGALADEDSAYSRILEHRFGEGDLAGHALGNLLIVSLALELGSFGAAIDEVAARVGAVGRVLPATVEPVALVGDCGAAGEVVGQVAVHNTAGVQRLRVEPADAPSPPQVVAAIEAADQVVIGPGSLFTSVLAAAVPPEVHRALASTRARRVYVANLAPQVPETAGYRVVDEVAALRAHGIEVDVVVVDPRRGPVDAETASAGLEVVVAVVGDATGAVHSPERLAEALAGLVR